MLGSFRKIFLKASFLPSSSRGLPGSVMAAKCFPVPSRVEQEHSIPHCHHRGETRTTGQILGQTVVVVYHLDSDFLR